ncbi:hypothetical protein Tco_0554777 [Tanacetum coccineum]
MVSYKDDLYKLLLVQVIDAPTIPVFVDSSEGNFRDAIDIGLDVDHPVPIVADAFPVVTIVTILSSLGEAIRGIHEYLQGVPIEEEMSTLRFKMGMVEAETDSLRGVTATGPRELQEAPGVSHQLARTSPIDTLF